MLAAMGNCSEALLEKMLEHGGGVAGVLMRSVCGKSALDYARMHKASPRVVTLLQDAQEVEATTNASGAASLTSESLSRTGRARMTAVACCGVCGSRLRESTKLGSLVNLGKRGLDGNACVTSFVQECPEVASVLLQPHFHALNDDRSFSKKLSQSLALLRALEQVVADLSRWHVVDLCCGKSLTSALAVLRHKGCMATAVDRAAAFRLPHYEEAGLGKAVQYIEMDLLKKGALIELEEVVASVGKPTAVLGMHLCGPLSEIAAELFVNCPLAAVCVLTPCCLPARSKAPRELLTLYRQGDELPHQASTSDESGRLAMVAAAKDERQYRGWCEYLCKRLEGTPRQTGEDGALTGTKCEADISGVDKVAAELTATSHSQVAAAKADDAVTFASPSLRMLASSTLEHVSLSSVDMTQSPFALAVDPAATNAFLAGAPSLGAADGDDAFGGASQKPSPEGLLCSQVAALADPIVVSISEAPEMPTLKRTLLVAMKRCLLAESATRLSAVRRGPC
eukprot:TRINITY_DN38043_c0_g2_i1.p1 TRINITY_DN38043_c0_g2~~TRINITY_DN38043_c0_g2_i1.p1  ORF type:complete len:545 (-),score=86.54 TRINITY_DN38043_c0_g2_i1:38-1570(-)